LSYCVYFIRCGSKESDPVKIGRTSNLEMRIKELQVGNPYELDLLFKLDCESNEQAKMLERFLHRQMYRMYHLRGEWFKIDKTFSIKGLLKKFNSSHKHIFGSEVVK
jgi:hypothetical protein